MIKPLLQALSPAGPRARLSILIFHRVLQQPDPLFPQEVDAARFDAICSWVRDWFNVLPLDVAVRRLQSGTLPPRALSITFDDGYADNHDVALPILLKHGLTATFFIATGFLDGGRMWNDSVIEALRRAPQEQVDLRGVSGVDLGVHPLGSNHERRAAIEHVIREIKYRKPGERDAIVDAIAVRADVNLPGDLMMRSGQVSALRLQGMQVGAHTVSHPILAGLGLDAIRSELADSKQALEALIGERVRLFAYPNGKPVEDYDSQAVAVARELGFDAAVSTRWGVATQKSDLLQLPRFTPWDATRWRFGLRLARNLRGVR